MDIRFRDRVDAGRRLAAALDAFRGTDAVVLALPRGGVVLGAEVAKALHAPLDVIITRKIGHPDNPEYAICALGESGAMICNEAERLLTDPAWFEQAVSHERAESARRQARYREGNPPIPFTGKTVIIVDDGIATGLTMRAAIAEVKRHRPKEIVVAVPVIPQETAQVLEQEADRVVALEIPVFFLGAVGAYYDDFRQVEDEEVVQLLKQDPLFLFTLPGYEALAQDLCRQTELHPGAFELARFPNDELHLMLRERVADESCFVLGAITPPDSNLLSALLFCHTLRKERASKVTAVFPYLAYMRQDKEEPGKSRATAWVGALLRVSGVDVVVTIDVHSALDRENFPMPLVSLSPAHLFAEALAREDLADTTLVAPDAGAVHRCETLQQQLGRELPIVRVAKIRTPEGVHATLQGPVTRRAVVIDDILDTGGTLIACCEELQRAGAEEILVMVTHGLFTGTAWRRLWDLGVTRIFSTNSTPLPAEVSDDRITIIPVQPLLAHWFSTGKGA